MNVQYNNTRELERFLQPFAKLVLLKRVGNQKNNSYFLNTFNLIIELNKITFKEHLYRKDAWGRGYFGTWLKEQCKTVGYHCHIIDFKPCEGNKNPITGDNLIFSKLMSDYETPSSEYYNNVEFQISKIENNE